jgi:hypothetical protein
MRRIYVKWLCNQEPLGFTFDKTDAQDYVAKTLAAHALKEAVERLPDCRWKLLPVDQTGGRVYIVAGKPP